MSLLLVFKKLRRGEIEKNFSSVNKASSYDNAGFIIKNKTKQSHSKKPVF